MGCLWVHLDLEPAPDSLGRLACRARSVTPHHGHSDLDELRHKKSIQLLPPDLLF